MQLGPFKIQLASRVMAIEELLTLYPYQGVFARGLKVLFDGSTSPYHIPAKSEHVPVAPSATEFDQVVSGFLMAAATTAKFIRRGDLWRAESWFAQDLRPHLLTMIRWDAADKDTWYGARFIEQWADPEILAELGSAFPNYNAESLKTSLLSLLGLFRRVGEKTGARFGLSYPVETHEKISGLIGQIFAEEP